MRARELPLRGALGFLIHSQAVRFDDGVIDDVAVLAYGIGKPGDAVRLPAGRRADACAAGSSRSRALQRPLRDLGGRLTITDDALATTDLRGTVAGLPLAGRGALYGLFGGPAFRLGLHGDGDLSAAARAVRVLRRSWRCAGRSTSRRCSRSKLAKPLIRNVFAGAAVAYDRFPIAALDGVADVYDGDVFVQGVRARYGAADVGAGRADPVQPPTTPATSTSR